MRSYLIFQVAGLTVGLPLSAVVETARLGDVDLVPGMPNYVRGVMRLRGQDVCVVDLALFLGRGAALAARRLVATRAGAKAIIALLVDDVMGVESLAGHALPPLLGDSNRQAVVELARLDGQLLSLLEAGRLPAITFERGEVTLP